MYLALAVLTVFATRTGSSRSSVRRGSLQAEVPSLLQILRESEERFYLVANTAPVLIWMSGTDKLCTFFNQGWLNFTGRSLKQELGKGWVAAVRADDRDRYLEIHSSAFDARVDFQMEYRLRRFDEVYRWIVDFGVPRLESDGSFWGYVGSCIDITDRFGK